MGMNVTSQSNDCVLSGLPRSEFEPQKRPPEARKNKEMLEKENQLVLKIVRGSLDHRHQ